MNKFNVIAMSWFTHYSSTKYKTCPTLSIIDLCKFNRSSTDRSDIEHIFSYMDFMDCFNDASQCGRVLFHLHKKVFYCFPQSPAELNWIVDIFIKTSRPVYLFSYYRNSSVIVRAYNLVNIVHHARFAIWPQNKIKNIKCLQCRSWWSMMNWTNEYVSALFAYKIGSFCYFSTTSRSFCVPGSRGNFCSNGMFCTCQFFSTC